MSNPQNPGDDARKPLGTTLADPRVRHQVGAPIGPYKLMERIGEGGFGLVFVAEQQRPVKRKVALKVIKPGMDTHEVIARFEAERQALALMDHPNIARVLDAGTTESGHPYFVMELVRGVPITDYCNENRLTLRERLDLFVSVCQAVQHAHQKGIIHRDIKPSNVLVTLHDGRPVVKVIDFGVAKALHQQLTDKTIYTRYTQVIGTPLYMSPEQAEMSGLDIDTRSDIYSLGVLLYELLTGTTPFDSKRMSKVAFDDLLRILRHEEPPKPSTRLRQSTKTLPAIAAQRRIEPGKLSKMFRGDLDWITMKALEKDRTRRYETASGLAADVLRYLHDEPVEASPPTTAYRLKKFARRNRTILATGLAFVAILLAGVIVSTWFAFQEKSERVLADQLRQKADDERQVAEAESQRADANARSASGEAENARRAQRAAEAEKQRALSAEARAITAQKAEALQRQYALANLDRSEKSLYLNRIALAERNWQAGNPKRVGEILDACPPKFRDWEWHYLNRLVHAEVTILPGDNAVYSPDGELLATSDNTRDEAVQIRDARSGKILMSLRGDHPIPFLQSLAFSPDSRRLAALCQAGAICIWNLPAGRQTLKVPVRLREETLKSPLRRPVGMAFSPDGKRIALAGIVSEKPNQAGVLADNLMVWDATTGKELLKVSNTGSSVAFSPDGKHLAITNCDMPMITDGMRILDADTGRVLTRFDPWRPEGFVPPHFLVGADDCHLTYSPDGKCLASARAKEIKIWDASSGKELRTLRGHSRTITALSLSADGKRLASGSRDETVQIWDPRRTEPLVVYHGHVGTVAAVAFRPNAKVIASTGEDGTVRIWSTTAEQGPRDISGIWAFSGSIEVSPDGRFVACLQTGRSAGQSPKGQYALVLIDASNGRQVRVLRSFAQITEPVHASLVFSSDGRLLASAVEQQVQIWDVATGQERARFAGLADFDRRGLAFSADGGRLAFTVPEDSVEVWDIHDHKRLTSYKGHRGPVTAIAFSPHGEQVASGSTDQTVQVWDAANGREIRKLKRTHAVQAGVAFSPDGRYLLATSPDNAVRVWDLEKGTEVQPLRGHKSTVYSIAFNPTGTRLVTAGRDLMIRLWTWPEREEILSLPVPFAPTFAGFVADGKKLAAAGDGVTVWDATPIPSSTTVKK